MVVRYMFLVQVLHVAYMFVVYCNNVEDTTSTVVGMASANPAHLWALTAFGVHTFHCVEKQCKTAAIALPVLKYKAVANRRQKIICLSRAVIVYTVF